MTKDKIVALVAMVIGVMAIVGGITLWTSQEKSNEPVKPGIVIEEKLIPETPPVASEGLDQGSPVDDSVTRIVIEDNDLQGDDINEILSNKVIIDDEVKDIDTLPHQ